MNAWVKLKLMGTCALGFPVAAYGQNTGIATVAGNGSAGWVDGSSPVSMFSSPQGVVSNSIGITFVADTQNHVIRKIALDGTVSTFAGKPGLPGNADGQGAEAQFNRPSDIVAASDGSLFVADTAGQTIRKISPSGLVTTFAGSGQTGFADGTGNQAAFFLPTALAIDDDENVYVADSQNYSIRKITPLGVVTTLIDSSTSALSATLHGLAVNGDGDVFVSDVFKSSIIRITTEGVISEFAHVEFPSGLCFDDDENLYVAKRRSAIVRISPDGSLLTDLAGMDQMTGDRDGFGTSARFEAIGDLSLAPDGTLLIADTGNHKIRVATDKPIIVQQPSGVSTEPGTVVSFEVLAENPTPVSLSWERSTDNGLTWGSLVDDEIITGSSTQSLTIEQAKPEMNGHLFRAIVSGNNGVTASHPSQLTVVEPPPQYLFNTFAGHATAGFRDGPALEALFNYPVGIALDSVGNLYIIDAGNDMIRRLTIDGNVETVAGSHMQQGFADGPGAEARFFGPLAIVIDSMDNLFVSDTGNGVIRRISPAGSVSTLAGKFGELGSNDGLGSDARFGSLWGLAVDASDNILVADSGSHTIRKVDPNGDVTTIAGIPDDNGSTDGEANLARFNNPVDIEADGAGGYYIADSRNQKIRHLSTEGMITTLVRKTDESGSWPFALAVAGDGSVLATDSSSHELFQIGLDQVISVLAGAKDEPDHHDGTGDQARFHGPSGIIRDNAGGYLVADSQNHSIRRVSAAGTVTTISGNPDPRGNADGMGMNARFNNPGELAVGPTGMVYVADTNNHTVRRISPYGEVFTIAGSPGNPGGIDGLPTDARFNLPYGIACGSDGSVFVADTENHAIRKISPLGTVSTFAGLLGQAGFIDGPANTARLNRPMGIVLDQQGNLLVVDASNYSIRKISPEGFVTTLAGNGERGFNDGPSDTARFHNPISIAVDSSGEMFVSEFLRECIRKISANGEVVTIAGDSSQSGTAFPNPGTDGVRFPKGLAFSPDGILHIVNFDHSTIWKRFPDGRLEIFAGQAQIDGSRDGTKDEILFSRPSGIAFDHFGGFYVSDSGNNTIRRGYVPTAINSPVSTHAGGRAATFSVSTNNFGATTYLWQVSSDGGANWENISNNEIFSGADSPVLTIPNPAETMSGTLFRAVTTFAGGLQLTTESSMLIVNPPPGIITSLSTRGYVGTGDDLLIAGIAISGTGTKKVLIRAVGPRLADFGIDNALEDPRMELRKFVGNTTVFVADNDDWVDAPNLAEILVASDQAFAFPLDGSLQGGTDDTVSSVILIDLAPGSYSASVEGLGSNLTGLTIVEVYAISGVTAELLSISTRGVAGSGNNVMIPGFAITERPTTLLIRGIGPSLSTFGVPNVLPDPRITIYRKENGSDVSILSNDDWGQPPFPSSPPHPWNDVQAVQTTAADAYAFPLALDSLDSSVVVTLNPGVYTVVSDDVDGSGGVMLVEVYLIR